MSEAPFQSHSQTSRAAAEAIKPSLNELQRRVLEFIRSQPLGATDNEIITGLQMNPSTARPRRVELVAKGLIESSGVIRNRCTVWRAR